MNYDSIIWIFKVASNLKLFIILNMLLLNKLYETNEHNEKEYVKLYLNNLKNINNLNLVDVSAYKILGKFAFNNDSGLKIIRLMITSKNLWYKRIAIISILYFIKNKSLLVPLEIILKSLTDSHHLIQNVAGWMLREIGKISKVVLLEFICENYSIIFGITLSYATEYLSGYEKEKLIDTCYKHKM